MSGARAGRTPESAHSGHHPHLQRAGEPAVDRRPGAQGAAPTCTCSSSTTAAPTAPASSPTSWRWPIPTASTSCTAPPRTGWARPTWRVSPGGWAGEYSVLVEMDADGSHAPEAAAPPARRRRRRRRSGDRVALCARRRGPQLAAAAAGAVQDGQQATRGCCSASTSTTSPPATAPTGARCWRRSTSPPSTPRATASRST